MVPYTAKLGDNMADVNYKILVNTTSNIDSVKTSKLLFYDTTIGSLGNYLADGTTKRYALTLDSSMSPLYAIGSLSIKTGATLTLDDITPGHVLFGGASGVVSGEENLFWDAANNRLGIGTDTPGATLEIVGGIGQSAVIDHGLTSLLPTNAYMLTGIIDSGVGGLKVIGATQTGYHGALELWGAFGGTLPIDEFPIVKIVGCKKGSPDTTVTALGSTNTVFQIANYTTPLVSVLGNGTLQFASGAHRRIDIATPGSGSGYNLSVFAGNGNSGSSPGHLSIGAGIAGESTGNVTITGQIIALSGSVATTIIKAGTSYGLLLQDDGGNGISIADGGAVGIGGVTVDADYFLQLPNSSSQKAKAYAWDTYACSEQWKKNIAPVENASDKLKNLNGITFVHDKPDTPEINGKEGIGITAESLEALGLPGLVTKSETGEYTGINLTNLIPVLVEAVKALTGRIETLEGAKP